MRRLLVLAFLATVATSILTDSARAEGWFLHNRKPFGWMDSNRDTVVVPGQVVTPPATTVPGTTPATPVQPNPMIDPGAAPAPQFEPIVSAALGDTSLAVAAPGYIDFAKPMNQFRLRYDAAYNMNRPDRAEYFYGKCGCFGGNAPGPLLPERSVDAQETSMYLELAPTERFSAFLDVPIRAINPDVNPNATGLGDMRFGFKYAFIYEQDRIVTLQMRGYVPSGDPRLGLGTSHYSVEPTLLYMKRLSDKWTLYGEVGDWIPVANTDFAGSILIYGAGLGYNAIQTDRFFVTPLVEFVGWTVLNGQELNLDAGTAVNARGDTIINGKIGVRAGNDRHDFYVGYGRALTGEVWYEQIMRLEYRLKF